MLDTVSLGYTNINFYLVNISGFYFLKMEAGDFIKTQKLILVKLDNSKIQFRYISESTINYLAFLKDSFRRDDNCN